jgi:hypothetical protein
MVVIMATNVGSIISALTVLKNVPKIFLNADYGVGRILDPAEKWTKKLIYVEALQIIIYNGLGPTQNISVGCIFLLTPSWHCSN